MQSVYADPYDSGYDHGCDDAEIDDPDDYYINQPEKGPAYHTDEFMDGYNDGFDNCSGSDEETSSDEIYDNSISGDYTGDYTEPERDTLLRACDLVNSGNLNKAKLALSVLPIPVLQQLAQGATAFCGGMAIGELIDSLTQ